MDRNVTGEGPESPFIGGYRLLYKIGSGTFSRVFRGVDPQSNRAVAVKVLRKHAAEDRRIVDAFLRDSHVGLALKHRNIVEVIAAGQDAASEKYYLVMEFVEGDNLGHILSIRKQMSVTAALKIIEDAGSALAHAHAQKVAHGDIKPSNLLIASSGKIQLVDFGLGGLYCRSKARGERAVDYAGLEQATNVKPGDIRSDIYFLGCILYQCLSGRWPLAKTFTDEARTPLDRFEQVRPIHRMEVQAPPSVFQLVDMMMNPLPTMRYQTPAQMLEAVRSARQDVEGTTAQGFRLPARSIFIIEGKQRLQDIFRDHFRERGFRVFLSCDPVRASDRFRQQPFDALIIDGTTTGEEGLFVLRHIADEAERRHMPFAAVMLLSSEQKGWLERIHRTPRAAALMHPVSLQQLWKTLEGLLTAQAPADSDQ